MRQWPIAPARSRHSASRHLLRLHRFPHLPIAKSRQGRSPQLRRRDPYLQAMARRQISRARRAVHRLGRRRRQSRTHQLQIRDHPRSNLLRPQSHFRTTSAPDSPASDSLTPTLADIPTESLTISLLEMFNVEFIFSPNLCGLCVSAVSPLSFRFPLSPLAPLHTGHPPVTALFSAHTKDIAGTPHAWASHPVSRQLRLPRPPVIPSETRNLSSIFASCVARLIPVRHPLPSQNQTPNRLAASHLLCQHFPVHSGFPPEKVRPPQRPPHV